MPRRDRIYVDQEGAAALLDHLYLVADGLRVLRARSPQSHRSWFNREIKSIDRFLAQLEYVVQKNGWRGASTMPHLPTDSGGP